MLTGDALVEEIADFQRLARIDWLVTRTSHRLHYATLAPEQLEDLAEWVGVRGPVRLACGRTAACVSIPSVLSRVGAPRCTGCCRKAGYPQGNGSPRNDPACRALLGLEAAKTYHWR